MKLKKNPNVDLRNKRTLFFEIGMVVTLTAVLMAFQYHSEEKNMMILANQIRDDIPEEFMPITRRKPPEPPELPKPQVPKNLDIVDNKTENVDPAPDFSSEGTPEVAIPVIPMPEEKVVEEPEFVYYAEKMPEFDGGMEALRKYLQKELQYPEEARENNIQGRVYVEFIVNKSGGIEKAIIKKGVDLYWIRKLCGW